ncbi:hypothetical protein KC131_05705, partial [Pseudomonas sp. JQ170]|uniref:hypothetical protein n=1 Tax=Pseudomonas sp. JQ170 TaxID=2828861 RepID=UPI00265219F1
FSEFLFQLQPLNSLRSLVSGRRILQRLNSLSTAFFTAADLSIEAPPALPETANSLKLKEFSIPITPEVGRIIDRSAGASMTYFNFVSVAAFWL